MEMIASVDAPYQVEAQGFERADDLAHQIAWLGRGSDFRRFVTNDVEAQLYKQTPGARLLLVICKETPRLETRVVRPNGEREAVVTDVSITFSLSLRIKTTDGAHWRLEIENNYVAANIHVGKDRRTLTQNFSVVAHEKLQ